MEKSAGFIFFKISHWGQILESLGTELPVGRDRSWSQRDRVSLTPRSVPSDLLWNLVGGGGKMERC